MQIKRALGLLLDAEELAKRKRVVVDSSSYRKEAWDVIKGESGPQLIQDLQDPTKMSRIPSLDCGNPIPLRIIGMVDMHALLSEWEAVSLATIYAMVLKGAKGVGKTTHLKALAFILYATLPATSRLICIWNMEVAHINMLTALQAALLFTYYLNGHDVKDEICSFQNLRDARRFIMKRQTQDGERFIFIVDGVQELDVQTWYGQERSDAGLRSSVLVELEEVVAGSNVLWGISPMGGKIRNLEEKPLRNVTTLDLDHGFPDASMSTFLAQTCLGAVLKTCPERAADVHYYCGHLPLFLFILDGYCRQFPKQVLRVTADNVTELARVMEDPECWDAVLCLFEEDGYIQGIETSLRRRMVKAAGAEEGPWYTCQDMMKVDSRYALNTKKGIFCSPFIEALYIDVFREREHALDRSQIVGSWVPYAKVVLCGGAVNWSEMGWVCERLCTDVVAKMGIQISDDLNLYHLSVQHFTRIPDVSRVEIKVGCGIVYIPNRYNFGSIDGVIVYKDMAGNLHFVGLQFTTSLDRHGHSEGQFMNVAVLEEWIPSILQRLQDWQLHYAFICMTSKDKVQQPSNIQQLWNGVCFGTVEHTLHVRSFADALSQQRVGKEVLQLLQEMTMRREEGNADPEPSIEEFPSQGIFPVKYSSAGIKRVTRTRLCSLASVSGKVDPDHYKTRDLLIDAMKSAGLLIVSCCNEVCCRFVHAQSVS